MSAAGRRRLIAANWKMHLLRDQAEAFCRNLVSGIEPTNDAEIVIFPSFPLLWPVSRALASSRVRCGGQDLHTEAKGAHTGDVSGLQLVDAGCTWVLCGHSERRRDHGESHEEVGAKAGTAREHGLVPLICLGETAPERQGGRTFEVLGLQLEGALVADPSVFEIAYEPVWAIGTGETATPETAQAAHAFLRQQLVARLGEERSAGLRILYGGSVNPQNAAALIAQPDIDGFLIGGASLDVDKFLDIIRICGARA